MVRDQLLVFRLRVLAFGAELAFSFTQTAMAGARTSEVDHAFVRAQTQIDAKKLT